MVLFTLEFVGLSCTDPSYPFGFFFLMDFIGTISMIFDISYMLGQDASKPTYAVGGDAKKNLMLLRAARAAKLGARAGRLSRVLKILRYLPFMRQPDRSDVAMARIISQQLSNLLATRVACLTIILVVILPIFSLVTFPEDDFSMQTWVQRLSTIVEDKTLAMQQGDTFGAEQAEIAFKKEIQEFAKFFSTLQYGPFEACFGKMGDEEFVCEQSVGPDLWTPTFEAPTRSSSK